MDASQPEKSLGVIFHPKFPPGSLADYARRAEAAGFDELWLWNDSFLPGALTSAAIALQATQRLRVGIGLMPAPAYNALFVAMEITTLALAFPERFLPGFGHGVGFWMEQIGAAPKSSLKALEETVSAVRRLLKGELVSLQGEQVRLDRVQMQQTPAITPPIYVGGIRQKTLQLAGRVGDGTILTSLASPEYVRWALGHIRRGMAEAGRSQHRIVIFQHVKVTPRGEPARKAARRIVAGEIPWSEPHVKALGITDEVAALIREYGEAGLAEHLPEAWLDALAAAGTAQQAAASIRRLFEAGADTVVFQPLDADPDCLDEYARYLMPLFQKDSHS